MMEATKIDSFTNLNTINYATAFCAQDTGIRFPDPPPVVITINEPYKSPNPIADFFCAPGHTTPWPHNDGYK